MPEANVLYSVTAAVVFGLVAWVAVVLKTAKEPWTREPPPRPARTDDVPVEGASVTESAASSEGTGGAPSSSLPKVVAGSAGGASAEATAEATAVVVAEKSESAAKADADAKADAKADDVKTDAKADDVKTDDAKTDDAKTDDAKTDDAKADDAKK